MSELQNAAEELAMMAIRLRILGRLDDAILLESMAQRLAQEAAKSATATPRPEAMETAGETAA